MSVPSPICRTVTVVAFRGDRTNPFAQIFSNSMQEGRSGIGPGPTFFECLLFAGHAGISLDGSKTIYGFNPDGGRRPAWQIVDGLLNGDRFPGIVSDDTIVFAEASKRGIPDFSLEVIVPDPMLNALKIGLDGERKKSKYWYGFPNGDGDCNCITWLERLGLPLLTGRMDEFAKFEAIRTYQSPRFGRCV
ncbi:MAG: hypothetical protein O3A29_08310 [Planctomycetota bacterium]|nr:hypothetical protein [Planctomycetota bacterium]